MARRRHTGSSFRPIGLMIAGSIIPGAIFAALALLYASSTMPTDPFANSEPRVVATSPYVASF
ncbi:hypothetical protein [Mesorhizobium sp. STM 4661]|uniref:hypothetical protein n=1 Tax=Mesorhizobium sp. STM 4661 TaxID=1297570 RepID=UPI0002BF2B70|nr:hypothetical protein [Mesorhizobium sp. STM 4661]CCV15318.1 exported hypothetical protein [Mesorhizobium sp. STM 4661]